MQHKKKLIITIVIITIFLLAGCTTTQTHYPISEQEQMYNAAKKEVLTQLKAPSTATFPDYDTATYTQTTQDKNTWIIQSYVDAQNGFGAMIRSSFICKVQKLSGNYYYCNDCAII